MRQMSLWDSPSLDATARVKSAMREALKACPKSREMVTDEMNALAAREGLVDEGRSPVTLALLDKWVAAGSPNRVPYHLLVVFCEVTNSLLPIQAMASPLGCHVITGEDLDLLEWARVQMEKRRLQARSKQIEQKLK
jgi:hypothetical protein